MFIQEIVESFGNISELCSLLQKGESVIIKIKVEAVKIFVEFGFFLAKFYFIYRVYSEFGKKSTMKQKLC